MLSIPLVLLSTFGCLCTAATASITADLGASSSVLHFGNLSYYVSDDAVTTWHCSPFVGGSGTLTTFITDETNITAKVLTGLLEEYGEDDVWTPAFLKAVALKTPSDAILTLDGYDWLLSHKIKYLLPSKGMQIHAYLSKNLTIVPDISLDELQSGPYIVNNNGSHVTTHEVYRLFEDKYQAFTQGIIPVPGSNGSFRSLSLYDSTSLNLLIPVPSRLYSLGDKRPLAGLRTVVKDLFDVKGTKTGGGSRVYLEMYPEKNESAVAVTKLLELGAIPVVSSSAGITVSYTVLILVREKPRSHSSPGELSPGSGTMLSTPGIPVVTDGSRLPSPLLVAVLLLLATTGSILPWEVTRAAVSVCLRLLEVRMEFALHTTPWT
jgi:hypothetical protein